LRYLRYECDRVHTCTHMHAHTHSTHTHTPVANSAPRSSFLNKFPTKCSQRSLERWLIPGLGERKNKDAWNKLDQKVNKCSQVLEVWLRTPRQVPAVKRGDWT
jgi:hypothetical protein